MDYTATALKALGKEIYDRDLKIDSLKWELNELKKQIAALEEQIKSAGGETNEAIRIVG